MIPHVISLVGLPAAGKSTVARLLAERYGGHWIRTRDIIQDLGSSGAIEDLQKHGIALSSEAGADVFFEELKNRIDPTRFNVVDALRPFTHWQRIKSAFGGRGHLVGIWAAQGIRKDRSRAREQRLEDRDQHPVEKEVPALLEVADYMVMNNGELDLPLDLLMAFIGRDSLPSYSSLLACASPKGGVGQDAVDWEGATGLRGLWAGPLASGDGT